MRKRRRNTKFSDACPFFFHLSQRFFLAKNNGPSFSSSISIYASLCGYDIISEGASLQLWECIRLLFLTFKKPRYDFYFQICFFSPPRVFFQCLRCCFWKALPFWTNQMTKSPSASLKIFRALVRQPWKRWHSCDINAPVALPRWGPRSIMTWYLCFFLERENQRRTGLFLEIWVIWLGWKWLCKQYCGGDETLCFCSYCNHWLWKMIEVYFWRWQPRFWKLGGWSLQVMFIGVPLAEIHSNLRTGFFFLSELFSADVFYTPENKHGIYKWTPKKRTCLLEISSRWFSGLYLDFPREFREISSSP